MPLVLSTEHLVALNHMSICDPGRFVPTLTGTLPSIITVNTEQLSTNTLGTSIQLLLALETSSYGKPGPLGGTLMESERSPKAEEFQQEYNISTPRDLESIDGTNACPRRNETL